MKRLNETFKISTPLFAPGVSFLLSFVLFYMGMAPGLSLQDSGELVTAVHSLGIPHPPGYPLFVLIGQIFKSIPISSIVFRLNLMSVFFSALTALVMALAIHEAWALVFKKESPNALVIAGAIFAAVSPSAYRQAVITEVYALNSFLCAVMIWLLLKLMATDFGDNVVKPTHPLRRSKIIFYSYCSIFGLTLTNHHTSWYFGILALFVLVLSHRALLRFPFLLRGFLLFALSLGLYGFLPWAARQSPTLNWGDPSNLRSFAQHIFRFQYDPHLYRPLGILVEQLREQVILLLSEYPLPLLGLGLLGLFYLFERNRKLFVILSITLIFTGPLTSLVTNFEIQLNGRAAYEEVNYLLSVFFLPHYLLWGLLIAIGCGSIIESLNLNRVALKTNLSSLIILIGAVAFGLRSYWSESKHTEQAALNIFNNWAIATKGSPALIVTNWDPFYFPSLYLQEVEGRLPNLVIIDTELMRTPWYIKRLKVKYPELMTEVFESASQYELSIEKVLAGDRPELATSIILFTKFLNDFIDASYAKMPVYLALHRSQRLLPAGVAESYMVRPSWVFGRLEKSQSGRESKLPSLDLENPDLFDFSGFSGPTMTNDFILRSVTVYHIQLLLETSIKEGKNLPAYSRRALDIADNLARRLGGEKAIQLQIEIEKVRQSLGEP
jgi:hypothetical protein